LKAISLLNPAFGNFVDADWLIKENFMPYISGSKAPEQLIQNLSISKFDDEMTA